MIRRHRVPIVSDPATSAAAGSGISPSFEVRGAPACGTHSLRLDRINSRAVLQAARNIYFRYLSAAGSPNEPLGVVIVGESPQGRVVFDLPVLLPEEQFVPIDLLRGRNAGRGRPGPGRTGRSPA